MTYNAKGFKTITHIGTADTTGAAGTNNCLHGYVSNDDAATVETANYFDTLLDPPRVKTGDLLLASLDIDGTPTIGFYQFTVSGGHVSIATAAGSQVDALTGTLTGTVDGAMADVPVPTDTPASADALRDDIATNVIPAINTNLKELQTAVNAIIAAL
jgi:hypothetical protein